MSRTTPSHPQARSTGLVLLAALALLPASARGQSSYQPYLIGMRTAGMGGAAAAFGRDSAMPWVNPAGLGRVGIDTFSLSANAALFRYQAVDRYYDISPAAAAALQVPRDKRRTGMSSTDLTFLPSSLSYVFQLDAEGDHVLALSLLAPLSRARNRQTTFSMRGPDQIGMLMLEHERFAATIYEIGPSYALRLGPVTLGLSAFLGYGTYERDYSSDLIDYDVGSDEPSLSFSYATSRIRSTTYRLDFAAGVQVGPFLGGFYAGAAVHSPSVPLAGKLRSKGYYYTADSYWQEYYFQTSSIEADDFNDPRPFWFTAGLGYERPGTFAAAVDVSYHLPHDYKSMRPELTYWLISNLGLDPQNPDQHVDAGVQQLDAIESERIGVVNVNAGLEAYLSERISLRAGFFTDFHSAELTPAAERDAQAMGEYKVDMFGGSLGLAYNGLTSQFQLAFVYQGGLGDAVAFELDVDDGAIAANYPDRSLAVHTFMFVFSGQIDARLIYDQVKRAVDEEIRRGD